MIGRRTAKNTTQTGGVFISGRGRDIFCLCFCPYLIECVNKFCVGIKLQICRNNAILTRLCPNIGERVPFGRFPAQHRRTSACLCRGVQSRKGYPFLVPARPGRWPRPQAGADRPRLWRACWMRVLCPMLRKGGRTSGCGGARRFAGCAVRRSKALSGTVYGHI